MCVSWIISQLLLSGLSAKLLKGKSLTKCCQLNKYCCVPLMLLFLCFIFPGLVISDDSTVASVPLGFEFSALDTDKNWVSENGVFAFGFLKIDGDDFDEYVVGIRYNLGDRAANMPVWTVGGGMKVPFNTTFRFDFDGKLILMDNSTGTPLWSSNTSTLGVRKATLSDSGNLVLLGSKDEVLWESFSSPTTTLLPGQSLHYPQTLRAPSTRTILSYYNLAITRNGELVLVWEHNVTYWRSHFSSKEARFDSNGVLGLYNDSNQVVWFASSKDYGDASVTLRHLRIDRDGNLRIYSWDNGSRSWRSVWQAVVDQCDVFASCGLYGVCGYNSSGPVCDCLYSDSLEQGVGGCKKMVDLENCKMHTSMFEMKQTVLYGLYPSQDVELYLSEAACRGFCYNDTACVAATSMNDGSGRCTVKRTSFISGHKTPNIQAVSFLKVCSVPQAANQHGNTESIASSRGLKSGNMSTRKLIGAIALIVILTLLVILSVQILLFWFMYRRRKFKVRTRIPFGKDAQMNPHYSILIRLSFEEIKELTNNFADQLGASVFKGLLPNKTPVVAKVLKDVVVSEKEFRVTVSTLSGTHHRNLVSVKGFCFEQGNSKCLLYEYVSNGSLDKWLFDNPKKGYNKEQIWQRKVDIALGVARAVAYLHSECQKCITHGNLKLENVLLDENLAPKVTDFGIRDLVTKNIPGSSSSSSESPSERDIFMLGELLLQIVTCKRDVLGENMGRVLDEVNQERCNNDNLEAIERIARISFWCMQSQPFSRPSIGEVVKVLEGTLSVDRPPSRGAFRRGESVIIEGEIVNEIELQKN
ncbi:hypothetical protein ABFS83_04G226900 [Erythranthe nasuta]